MVAGMLEQDRSKSNRRLQWRPLMRNAARRRRLFKLMVSLAIYSIAAVGFAQGKSSKHRWNGDNDDEHEKQPQTGIMWINHLELLPGDSSVIMSNTTGDTATGGGNKVVEKGLQVPPGFLITGVRVCYELSNARSFIDQIRLSQVQDPPGTALVQLDDATHLVNPGPRLCGQRSDDGQSRTWCSALGLASQFRGYLRQDSGPRSRATSGRTVNLGEQLDSGQSATPIVTGAVRNSSIKTSAAEAAFASDQK